MDITIEIKVLTKIKKARGGALFFTDDFINFGNKKAVSKALQRLVDSDEIIRVATGIYTRPEKDPILGLLHPTVEKIAEAIAKRDKARIIPTGAYALNRIGLSTQVPMNVVFLTDGSDRKIKVGKQFITFKKTSPKNVAAIGSISKLVIQALRSIGKTKVTESEILHVQKILKNENQNHLKHDLRLAPEWIRQIMRVVINNNTND